jgi:hypothetical protein
MIELDDGMAARLESIAPRRSLKRSQFVRTALDKALWDAEEQKMAEAYRRQPDSAEAASREREFWEREWARFRKARGRRGQTGPR